MGRVIAKQLSKYLPGSPELVVRNMPGGGDTIGPNYAYSRNPDGLTFLGSGSSPQFNQLVGQKGVQYDVTKMTLVVSVGSGAVYVVRSSIIDKPEDILKARGIIWGSGAGGFGVLFALAREVLGFSVEKASLAYPGSSDARRAFLSGEVNMTAADANAFNTQLLERVQKGEVLPVFQSGLLDVKGDLVRDPSLPFMTIKELYEKVHGKQPSGIEWDAYRSVVAIRTYDFVVLLPPNMPDNIAKAYWDAAEKMLKDAEFRQIVNAMVGKDAPWYTGEALNKAYKAQFSIDPKVAAWIKGVMSTKYGQVFD